MPAPFWEKSYPPGVSSAEPLPSPTPLEEVLSRSAERWGEQSALDFYDRVMTYRELYELSARAAKGLQALGVGPGVHVGIHLLNTPHYPVCAFAVLMAGGVVVNLNPHAAEDEVREQIVDSQTRIVITMTRRSLYGRMAPMRGTTPCEALVLCRIADFVEPAVIGAFAEEPEIDAEQAAGATFFAALIANDGAFVRHPHGPLDRAIAVLAYSGGTTGDPKAAMLTHANFSAMIGMFLLWAKAATWPHTRKALVVLPLCHIFGFASMMLLCIATGGVLVLQLGFDINRVVSDLGRKCITTFAGVPAMYSMLVSHSKIRETDLSALRYCNVAGAPLPLDLLRRFREVTGLTPQLSYGLTETTAMATMQIPDNEPRPGTSGLPVPHTALKIVDIETGTRTVPLGEAGEICCAGPHVMKGYWHQPEETRRALEGGHFHTGDIGFLDEDGYLTLVDRKKDMLIVGGKNVFPQRIERVLYEHPAVFEAAVVGIDERVLGQTLKAFVALNPGYTTLTYQELKAFLTPRLASYEMPTVLEIWATLPKTSVGKIARRELVEGRRQSPTVSPRD